MSINRQQSVFSLAVIVAALGYFVDIYDLLLFTIVKKTSMLAVGSSDATMLADSTKVINWQMAGLLIGGIIWGMLGDKKGRLSVLFGSIILYSIANFITAYITTVDHYAWCRFVAGLGLAGELGAGITLVSELLPKEKRGIGTSGCRYWIVWRGGCIFYLSNYKRLEVVLQDWWRIRNYVACITYKSC